MVDRSCLECSFFYLFFKTFFFLMTLGFYLSLHIWALILSSLLQGEPNIRFITWVAARIFEIWHKGQSSRLLESHIDAMFVAWNLRKDLEFFKAKNIFSVTDFSRGKKSGWFTVKQLFPALHVLHARNVKESYKHSVYIPIRRRKNNNN